MLIRSDFYSPRNPHTGRTINPALNLKGFGIAKPLRLLSTPTDPHSLMLKLPASEIPGLIVLDIDLIISPAVCYSSRWEAANEFRNALRSPSTY